jgi:hypothetical protein
MVRRAIGVLIDEFFLLDFGGKVVRLRGVWSLFVVTLGLH